ncbi:TetR/AcrR family transcriptional regulator [Pseudonocardia sp. ICBG1293]|uniref:TetR/AcrR family transcriptional regulator n=1 Tax=Pseudonocardia sp. ICBG1293 TaxID=2844382 RepID=UPI001CD03769|nr:TetR/AcrR family transcriptional regulator [Pseudonocardia sp. ICBG1293]
MTATPSSPGNGARGAATPDPAEPGAASEEVSRIRPRLRRDAEANRRRILEVAERVLRDRGHDAPVSALSEASGLGAATVYRHFPSRDALVQALHLRAVERYERAVEAAVAEPDALRRVERLLRVEAAAQVDCRACGDWFPRAFPARVREHRARLRCVLGDSLTEAHAAGLLRDRVTVEDLLLAVSAVDGALRACPDDPAAAAQRVVTLVLRGILAVDAQISRRSSAPRGSGSATSAAANTTGWRADRR